MSPFFNFPEDETPTEKEARKKKLANLAQGQEILRGQSGPEGIQTVPLLCCRQGANAMGQDHERDAHEESLDWRQRQIQQGNPCKVLDFFHGLHQAPQAHRLPC
jgi:hypothetical protein